MVFLELKQLLKIEFLIIIIDKENYWLMFLWVISSIWYVDKNVTLFDAHIEKNFGIRHCLTPFHLVVIVEKKNHNPPNYYFKILPDSILFYFSFNQIRFWIFSKIDVILTFMVTRNIATFILLIELNVHF